MSIYVGFGRETGHLSIPHAMKELVLQPLSSTTRLTTHYTLILFKDIFFLIKNISSAEVTSQLLNGFKKKAL